jgi:hypothetical protein
MSIKEKIEEEHKNIVGKIEDIVLGVMEAQDEITELERIDPSDARIAKSKDGIEDNVLMVLEISDTLLQLDNMLKIFNVISTKQPSDIEYKTAQNEANQLKQTIMDEYREKLLELNSQNLDAFFTTNKNPVCGSVLCIDILKKINSDNDFDNLIKESKVPKELKDKLVSIISKQSGGSRKQKTHRLKQTNDLIYW